VSRVRGQQHFGPVRPLWPMAKMQAYGKMPTKQDEGTSPVQVAPPNVQTMPPP
jgi:hypothetical protein